MVFKILAKISVFFYVVFGGFVANSQSASDSKLLLKMTTVLSLDSEQVNSLDSVFTTFSFELDSLNAKIKQIQTSDISEDEINKQSSVLFQERKDLRTWKNNQITSNLTPEQKLLYQKEILTKARPVLHFGHDKADCKVCIKPENGAMKSP